MPNQVKNLFPTTLLPHGSPRIALIGEAPGQQECELGQPFVGKSGKFLSWLLSRNNITREQVFLGNVCQVRPPNNQISLFSWSGDEIQSGLSELKKDIENFQPNIVVCLGNIPLKAAKDPLTNHPLNPKNYAYKNSKWRGSVFYSHPQSPFNQTKTISTFHPAYVLRCYDNVALFQFDLRKAMLESKSKKVVEPTHIIHTVLCKNEILGRLACIRARQEPVALDIEGGVDSMSCISFATSKTEAFIIPFIRKDGSFVWSPTDSLEIYLALAKTLEDPHVPKILQNSLYDTFVLQYSYNIRVRNVSDDTMLKHWEMYSELPKSLDVQTSLYTNVPYYKGDRHSQDDETFYRYCCLDSLVTYEINQVLSQWINKVTRPRSYKHYRMNMALLSPLRAMELGGIKYDTTKAKERRSKILRTLFEQQAKLNGITGFRFAWKSCDVMSKCIESLMAYKLDITRTKKGYIESRERAEFLLYKHKTPDLSTIGELETLCEVGLNVGSPKQLTHYLYNVLGLPPQFKEKDTKDESEKNYKLGAGLKKEASTKETVEERIGVDELDKVLGTENDTCGYTSNYEALLKLSKICKQAPGKEREYEIIQDIITIRALNTRQRMLAIYADSDGRIRCGYNVVGSDTGRITCYTSPTGSGYNLQTIPNYTKTTESPGGVLGDRDLFLADEGYYMFQCDLSGADGWTVAAYCKMLGDSTMLDDYLYGLKPAKILALMIRKEAHKYNFKDRKELAELSKSVSKDDWDYFACKRVQHGANYMEGPTTIGKNVLTDSEGKLYMTDSECRRLRDMYFLRYPGIARWHNFIDGQLKQKPFLTCASGQTRQFFGRPKEILTKAVAFEPQANTTYATNLAMQSLWNDKENRIETWETNNVSSKRSNGNMVTTLRIQPLHQVHDALIGQFKTTDVLWAVEKIKSYFNNEITIAGQKITIPFEGGYGKSWGELSNKI